MSHTNGSAGGGGSGAPFEAQPDAALIAKLDGIDVAVVATTESQGERIARALGRKRRHEYGVFSGWLGETGGPCNFAILVAGGPGADRAWAATRQAAMLCPNAAAILHVAQAGALDPLGGGGIERGDLMFAAAVEPLLMPATIFTGDEPAPAPASLRDAAWGLALELAEYPAAVAAEKSNRLPTLRPAASSVELAAHANLPMARLLSTDTKIDSPAQRDWIESYVPHRAAMVEDATDRTPLLIDAEGFPAAVAGVVHGVPVVLLRIVTDSLATLSPCGLAHDDRPRRPSLIAALDAAAPRIIGLGRALADAPSRSRG